MMRRLLGMITLPAVWSVVPVATGTTLRARPVPQRFGVSW
jgi:hypothetical protein